MKQTMAGIIFLCITCGLSFGQQTIWIDPVNGLAVGADGLSEATAYKSFKDAWAAFAAPSQQITFKIKPGKDQFAADQGWHDQAPSSIDGWAPEAGMAICNKGGTPSARIFIEAADFNDRPVISPTNLGFNEGAVAYIVHNDYTHLRGLIIESNFAVASAKTYGMIGARLSTGISVSQCMTKPAPGMVTQCGITMDQGVSSAVFDNNVFGLVTGLDQAFCIIAMGNTARPINTVEFINNTFAIVNDNAGSSAMNYGFTDWCTENSLNNVKWINNIFYCGTNGVNFKGVANATYSGLVVEINLYSGFAMDWQNFPSEAYTTGNNIDGDPLFLSTDIRNISAEDFLVPSFTGPAAGAGSPTDFPLTVQEDYFGTPRVSGSLDIGAMVIEAPTQAMLKLDKNQISAFVTQGDQQPSDQTITITNGGLTSIVLTAVSVQVPVDASSWLTCTPSGAAGNSQTITVHMSSAAITGGTFNYTAVCTVTCGNAGNSPKTFTVSMMYMSTSVLPQEALVPLRGQANTFRIQVPAGFKGSALQVRMIGIDGKIVQQINRPARPGAYIDLRWDGRNASGVKVSSGVYFLNVDFGQGNRVTRKILRE
jgi:hypothetical protein